MAAAALAATAAALVGATVSPARPSGFGLSQTKACLTAHGAQFQASDPVKPEGAKATIPDGSGPDFLYLAIGRNSADAIAVRAKLLHDAVPAPTTKDSVSAGVENAAWTIVTLSGAHPSAKVQATVRACLTTGAAPAPPTAYDARTFSACAQAAGPASTVTGAEAARLMRVANRWVVPGSLLSHIVLMFTASDPSAADGPAVVLVFGRSHADALRLRASVETVVHEHDWWWKGSRKNLAWLAYRTRTSTPRGEAAARAIMKRCLP